MKRNKKINEDQCDVKGCQCNVNYMLVAIAVIFIVMFIATTIK
ncbi:hypothetical protein [Methanobacterium spitsbergense]|nr:hypothetical protein [Methanobacterium spitsbergense]